MFSLLFSLGIVSGVGVGCGLLGMGRTVTSAKVYHGRRGNSACLDVSVLVLGFTELKEPCVLFLDGCIRVGGMGTFPRPCAVFPWDDLAGSVSLCPILPLKEMVVICPRSWAGVCGNRRRRKKIPFQTISLALGSRCEDSKVLEFGYV